MGTYRRKPRPARRHGEAHAHVADRGKITSGVLDGPLAFEHAVLIVAGRADVLVVPDLKAGNMLAKPLEYLAAAQAAAIVLGKTVPIVLTSRAETVQTRLASCAAAVLLALQWKFASMNS